MRIDDPATLETMIGRLESLRPDAERRWGTLEVREMLSHLADAHAALISGELAAEKGVFGGRILKWMALYSPLPWAKNAQTHPKVDPRREGSRPGDFDSERRRAIETLRAFVAFPPEGLAETHMVFGPMTPRDWYRSTYRHLDHHLRQFGA